MLGEVTRRPEATDPSSTLLLKRESVTQRSTPPFLPKLRTLALGFCTGGETGFKMENTKVFS